MCLAQLRCKKRHPYKFWARKTIQNHKHRGFSVNIDIGQLEILAMKTEICYICGVKLDYSYKGKSGWNSNSPSLDRVDNNRELSLETIQIICSQCNSAKHQMSMKDFVKYCELVVKRNQI